MGQREEGGAAAHQLAVGGLEAKAHRGGDPVTKAHRAQVGDLQPLEHRQIAARVIGQRQVERAARADCASQRRIDPGIGDGGTETGLGPAVEGHMDQRRIQQPLGDIAGRILGSGGGGIVLRVGHLALLSGSCVGLDKIARPCYTATSCKSLQLESRKVVTTTCRSVFATTTSIRRFAP